jgi:hypothetical protein
MFSHRFAFAGWLERILLVMSVRDALEPFDELIGPIAHRTTLVEGQPHTVRTVGEELEPNGDSD